MIKRIIFVISLFLVFSSVQSQELLVKNQTLSVKGRWNIKAGFSLYKITTATARLIEFDWTKNGLRYKRKFNVRVEANYGIFKWLEAGLYIGLMGYEYGIPPNFLPNELDAVAPTFGVNVNIHILPFFVKNPKCKWDFYIPLKYGGNYIPKVSDIVFDKIQNWDDLAANMTDDEFIEYCKTLNRSKYRHEYGAGLGAAVYIKNIMGFYVEVMGGQFSYINQLVKSPYNIRVGLTAKF